MLISDSYKEQIRLLHVKDPGWGSANKHSASLNNLMKIFDTKDILDYGCGKGNLGKSLRFPIQEYDPGLPEKDIVPKPADIVLCLDVLEHIEPEYIDNVLLDIKRCIKKAGFFQISTREAPDFLPDGRNAHLLIRDWLWWVEKMNSYFRIIEIHAISNISTRSFINQEMIFLVVPKESSNAD